MEANYSTAPPVETTQASRQSLLLKHVFALYREQFSSWFAVTAPTSLLAAAVLWMADQRIRAMSRSIPLLEIKHHPGIVAVTIGLRLGSFFVSWLLGSFALAAIATVVNNLDGEDADSVWKHDSHQRAREHFRALVLAALFMFCAFGVGMAGAGFVALAAARIVGWSHFARFSDVVSIVSVVVVASVVSWFGMAIPITLRGNIKVGLH